MDFELNDLVLCAANGNMEHDFIGRIEKKYENSAMVTIMERHAEDHWNAIDLAGRAIISFSKMEAVGNQEQAEIA